MTIAAVLCAWAAGVSLGWRLGLIHRRTNDEMHYWITATADRSAFDWAKEPE